MQKDELNLLEDGLQLWVVTLRNAPQPHPGVIALFPHLAAVMQKSTGKSRQKMEGCRKEVAGLLCFKGTLREQWESTTQRCSSQGVFDRCQ